jgi:NhaP-type Na+/H+ or K+/H+ antiporter
MNEQEELFSPNQLQLWKLAWWSKSLSIIVLVIYLFAAGFQVLQSINTQNNDPIRILNLGVNIAVIVLQGVVYYLVLQGVALGLSMVVETDINYRERSEVQNEQ